MSQPNYPTPTPTWPGLTHLTEAPVDALLDLDRNVGQRQSTFVFQLVNGVSGIHKGFVTPVRGSNPTLSHDTTRTTKRQLSVAFGVADTALIQEEQDRIFLYMLAAGRTWPLGHYAFSSEQDAVSTGGSRSTDVLLDEMTNVDQQLEAGFPSVAQSSTIFAVETAVGLLLQGFLIPGIDIAPSPFNIVGAWGPGTTRGQVLAAMAQQGDFQTPWFGNDGRFKMIRTVNPEESEPTIDMDRGARVIRDSITATSTLLSAPNRFIVISNGGDAQKLPIVGRYDVPPSAPNSIQNIGFVRPSVTNAQLSSQDQANAAARQVGLNHTITRTVQLVTPPDPRHDGYDVVRWQAQNWLEIAWSMQLTEGGQMTHTLRRSFA